MIRLCFLLAFLISPFKSRLRLETTRTYSAKRATTPPGPDDEYALEVCKRFAPTTTKFPHRREMTRWAGNGHAL
jgi:hypothetical protein